MGRLEQSVLVFFVGQRFHFVLATSGSLTVQRPVLARARRPGRPPPAQAAGPEDEVDDRQDAERAEDVGAASQGVHVRHES